MAEATDPTISVTELNGIDSAVERRLARAGVPIPLLIAIIGALLAVSSDTVLLSTIPLLPDLEKLLGMSASQGALSLSVTGIAFAASVPVSARLGDMFGIRRLLLISTAAVIVGNLLCATAESAAPFLVGRAVMGFSAALPLFYALLRLRSDTVRGIDRYAGLMTGSIGAGIVIAFMLAGVVLELGGSARDVLWIMLGLAALVFVLVWLFIPDSLTRTRGPVDYPGAVLVALIFGLIVTAFGQGNEWGWTSSATLALLVAGVALMPVWAWRELKTRHPLIDVRVIRRREIWPPYIASGTATMVAGASCLTISNFVQTPTIAGYGYGGTVLVAALYLLPQGFCVAFGGWVMTPVIARIGQRNAAVLGGMLLSAFFLWFSLDNDTHTWQLILESVFMGSSWALTYTASVSAYLRGARPGEGGMVAGGAQAIQQGIAALGPTIITALLTASFVPHMPIPRLANFGHVWFFFGCCGIVIIIASLLIRDSRIDQRLAPNTEVVGATAPVTNPAAGASRPEA